MTPARTRARRGEGERLREEILDVAEDLLVSTGDENAVSIRAIAQRVGVTPPSIYLHFADKESLLWAVCEREFRPLCAARCFGHTVTAYVRPAGWARGR